jgi:transposase
MLRMDEFTKIYKDFHLNHLSINEIAVKYNRSWETVKKYTSKPPSEQVLKQSRSRSTVVINDIIKHEITSILEDEKKRKVHRKHRFTANTAFEVVLSRCEYIGSFRTFRRHFSVIKALVYSQPSKSYIELDFDFGKYLQIDHGPATVIISGHKVDGYLFIASVPGEVIRYSQFYPVKASESWGLFHESCFKFFGGVFENLIYDNDSVIKIPSTGKLTSFFIELQAHYKFKGIFCNKASGWEKGAVENAVGYCRRNFLPGIMEFNSYKDLNFYLESKSMKDIEETIHYKTGAPVIKKFLQLSSVLDTSYCSKEWGIWSDLKVNTCQCVLVNTNNYSTPEKYIGSTVRVFKSAFEIKIASQNDVIAKHERTFIKGEDSIELDHYLEQLYRKPGAFKHAKVVKKAKFSRPINRMLEELPLRFDTSNAHREFIQILSLKRRATESELDVAIELAIECSAVSFHGVQSILQILQVEDQKALSEIKNDYQRIDSQFNLEKYEELVT